MVENLTVVIPFFNGHQYIDNLIQSIPKNIPVLIIDDHSDDPLHNQWGDTRRVTVVRPSFKGYFTGAVNYGIGAVETDVLVINQDTWFEDSKAFEMVDDRRNEGFAMVGERIRGTHPSFGSLGYIHGTFMFLRRDAISQVGFLNEADYPLWGATAEYQWRMARHGFPVLPLDTIPGFHHERGTEERYGSSIKGLLDSVPTVDKKKLVRTPPLLSVIVPCYNYGKYVSDCINSLIGGPTSLGMMKPQTLQSFEIIIVDDAGWTKDWAKIQDVVSDAKGIRAYRLPKNLGTAGALNFGIERAVGEYITFLSADDMREYDSLERLVRACQANPHSFAYDDIMLMLKDRRVKEWSMGDYDFEMMLYKNNIHAGIVYPKKAWEEAGGYPQIMKDGREDWAFNVALGIHGWCGVHVAKPGYLYRRENQNRSLTNTSPEHHERFLSMISGLFPDVYGGYRPTMCCGKKPKSVNAPSVQRVTERGLQKSLTSNQVSGGNLMAASTGTGDMVGLVYKGKQQPTVWDGGVTNIRYRFGVGKEFGWVDVRDAGERGKKGFLSLKDSQGAWLFEQSADTASTEAVQTPTKQAQSDVKVVVGGEAQPVAETVQTDVTEETSEEVPTSPTVFSSDFPNPSEYNAKEIMAMELDAGQWRKVYEAELVSEKPRKSLITWLEEKLAGV